MPFLETKLRAVITSGDGGGGTTMGFAQARTTSGLPTLWDHLLSPTWGSCRPHHPLSLKTVSSSSCSFFHGWLLGPKETSPESYGTRYPHP